MKRFYDHVIDHIFANPANKEEATNLGLLGADGHLALSNHANGTIYKQLYKVLMKVNYEKLMPARGWPELLGLDDAVDCSANVLNFIKKAAEDKKGETWDRHDVVAKSVNATNRVDLSTGYLDTGDFSYCEYSTELGMWHNCQNQEQHSVNPRCDPRFWFYAGQVITDNRDAFEAELANVNETLTGSNEAEKLDALKARFRDQVNQSTSTIHRL